MSPGDRAWYAGRRVFLTGHTGFKGAWLALWLKQMGADLTGFALAPETPSLFSAANVDEGIVSIIGDIRDRRALESALAASKPEIIIHMAAQSLVRRSYADPVETFDVNVRGAAAVLDCARRLEGARAVVVVTSDKCYENAELGGAFRETDPMGGADPYSASKGCAELVTSAFSRSFFSSGAVAVASARAGNVIGGGDWAEDRLMPDMMRAAIAGAPVLIRRPNAVRPWQFVLEPLRGYLMLARRLAEQGRAFAGGWNFGPDAQDMVSVRDVVGRVDAAWPAFAVEYLSEQSGPKEAEALRLDCAKAAALLGWRPAIGLHEAVRWTVDWHRMVHENPGRAREVALMQLLRYEDRVTELEVGT
jgi:CDP-glucose 4,6-dehydratase